MFSVILSLGVTFNMSLPFIPSLESFERHTNQPDGGKNIFQVKYGLKDLVMFQKIKTDHIILLLTNL